jgi:hypothetical protein
MPIENYNIAIIARDNTIYAWQQNVLKQLLVMENISVSLLLSSVSPAKKPPLALRFIHHIERFLYNCQPDFFIEQAADNLLENIQKISLPDMQVMDLSEIDFAVNFSGQVLPDELLKQPKLGVWSIFIGDNEKVNSNLTAEPLAKLMISQLIQYIHSATNDQNTINNERGFMKH